MQHLDANKIHCDQQYGFTKQRSCESQLLVTLQDSSASLEDGDRHTLSFSTSARPSTRFPINASLWSYSTMESKVPSSSGSRGFKSKPTGPCRRPLMGVNPCHFRRPSRYCIGVTAVLLYINDLRWKVSSTTRLFADDSFLYMKIRSSQDAARLQDDLDCLQQWEKGCQMSFNPYKCIVIRITKKRNPIKGQLQHLQPCPRICQEIPRSDNVGQSILEYPCEWRN